MPRKKNSKTGMLGHLRLGWKYLSLFVGALVFLLDYTISHNH